MARATAARHAIGEDPYPSRTVAAYTPADRAFMRRELVRALSRLRSFSERDIAATINSWVFQRLRSHANSGSGVKMLRDGYGACGGGRAVRAIAGIPHSWNLSVTACSG
jgi:hypothetical protein